MIFLQNIPNPYNISPVFVLTALTILGGIITFWARLASSDKEKELRITNLENSLGRINDKLDHISDDVNEIRINLERKVDRD